MQKKIPFQIICALLLLCSKGVSAQIVVNSYASVISVTNSSGHSVVTVDSSSLFIVDDKVLIIQMKGAVIDSSNDSTFGNITSLNNAGNYEFAQVSGISGNKVTLNIALSKSYTPAGHVQLIKVFVPTLDKNNNYTVSSTLTARPWNGSKGGIFALETTGNLTLNANIDVTGKGFKGGRVSPNYYNPVFGITDWAFMLNPDTNTYGDQGGQKGEGIADYLFNLSAGRGKQANGGGGGNGHKCGGGGGGNGGVGGMGGRQANSTGNAWGGRGGVTLTDSGSNRIFFGGGGGGGHQHNGTGTGGGNGGGIVIIRAKSISSSGSYGIIANGDSARSVRDYASDGVGGGGAGGTVLLDIASYSNAINIYARGGKGGDCAYLYTRYEYTAGSGGGGGGVVYYTGSKNSSYIKESVSAGRYGESFDDYNDSTDFGSTSGITGTSDTASKLIYNQTFDGIVNAIQNNLSLQVYPNPFSNETSIKYSLSAPSHIQISILDLSGRQITNLTDRNDVSGNYTLPFDATKYNCQSGIYFVKMVTNDAVITQKIIVE